jgi:hypothetical protein
MRLAEHDYLSSAILDHALGNGESSLLCAHQGSRHSMLTAHTSTIEFAPIPTMPPSLAHADVYAALENGTAP